MVEESDVIQKCFYGFTPLHILRGGRDRYNYFLLTHGITKPPAHVPGV